MVVFHSFAALIVREALTLLLALAVLLGLWIATPSSLFFQPGALVIENGIATHSRLLPLGPTKIRYVEKVEHASGLICQDSGGPLLYERTLVRWPMDWAAPCMIDGKFTWSGSWTVYWLGVLPLRPVRQQVLFVAEDETAGLPPVGYMVAWQ